MTRRPRKSFHEEIAELRRELREFRDEVRRTLEVLRRSVGRGSKSRSPR